MFSTQENEERERENKWRVCLVKMFGLSRFYVVFMHRWIFYIDEQKKKRKIDSNSYNTMKSILHRVCLLRNREYCKSVCSLWHEFERQQKKQLYSQQLAFSAIINRDIFDIVSLSLPWIACDLINGNRDEIKQPDCSH